MINKQSLWFITLFSLILILGIYYITMPSQFLKNIEDVKTVNSEISVDVSESDKTISKRIPNTFFILISNYNRSTMFLIC